MIKIHIDQYLYEYLDCSHLLEQNPINNNQNESSIWYSYFCDCESLCTSKADLLNHEIEKHPF